MDENKVCEDRHRNIDNKLEDHEERLRILERNDLKRELQYSEIQKRALLYGSIIGLFMFGTFI
jgi:hypothetical protein